MRGACERNTAKSRWDEDGDGRELEKTEFVFQHLGDVSRATRFTTHANTSFVRFVPEQALFSAYNCHFEGDRAWHGYGR
jgi:hypothetical protein